MSENRNARFGSIPGEGTISQCAFCKFKHSGAGTCDAFPDGIPEAVLLNKVDHRKPLPGDKGIRFEAYRTGVVHPIDRLKHLKNG